MYYHILVQCSGFNTTLTLDPGITFKYLYMIVEAYLTLNLTGASSSIDSSIPFDVGYLYGGREGPLSGSGFGRDPAISCRDVALPVPSDPEPVKVSEGRKFSLQRKSARANLFGRNQRVVDDDNSPGVIWGRL